MIHITIIKCKPGTKYILLLYILPFNNGIVITKTNLNKLWDSKDAIISKF